VLKYTHITSLLYFQLFKSYFQIISDFWGETTRPLPALRLNPYGELPSPDPLFCLYSRILALPLMMMVPFLPRGRRRAHIFVSSFRNKSSDGKYIEIRRVVLRVCVADRRFGHAIT